MDGKLLHPSQTKPPDPDASKLSKVLNEAELCDADHIKPIPEP